MVMSIGTVHKHKTKQKKSILAKTNFGLSTIIIISLDWLGLLEKQIKTATPPNQVGESNS